MPDLPKREELMQIVKTGKTGIFLLNPRQVVQKISLFARDFEDSNVSNALLGLVDTIQAVLEEKDFQTESLDLSYDAWVNQLTDAFPWRGSDYYNLGLREYINAAAGLLYGQYAKF